jgi:antitoxin component YwqK of YwqJK toxin-antitoxin module
MKAFLFLYVLLIVNCNAFSQLIAIDTIHTKELRIDKIIYTYKDSVVNHWFWDNGQMRRRFTIDSLGNCIGKTTSWFEDGKVQRNGLCMYKTIIDTSWYENRIIQSLRNVLDGEGKQQFFDEQGNLTTILYYKNGSEYKNEEYCLDGFIRDVRYNRKEPYNFKSFYCNKNPQTEGAFYDNFCFVGPYKHWYENRVLKEEGTYVNYSESSKLKCETKIGIWKYYDEKGELIKLEEYDNCGKLVKSKEYE